VGTEFCGTSITSRSNGNAKNPDYLAENPHFVFADSERKGYGVVELTPGKLTTTLRVVSDVTRVDSGVQTLAQFTLARGGRDALGRQRGANVIAGWAPGD
jgi:alkaline phosphatase D